jgi:hypothetical protein
LEGNVKKTDIEFSITQTHLDRAIAARMAHVERKSAAHWDATQHCIVAQAATDALPKGGVVEAGLQNASRYAEDPNGMLQKDRRIGITHWLDIPGAAGRTVRNLVRQFDQEQFDAVAQALPLTVPAIITDYEIESKENA